jgi:hypothetical protein
MRNIIPPHPLASLATSPHRGEVSARRGHGLLFTSPLWGEVGARSAPGEGVRS